MYTINVTWPPCNLISMNASSSPFDLFLFDLIISVHPQIARHLVPQRIYSVFLVYMNHCKKESIYYWERVLNYFLGAKFVFEGGWDEAKKGIMIILQFKISLLCIEFVKFKI